MSTRASVPWLLQLLKLPRLMTRRTLLATPKSSAPKPNLRRMRRVVRQVCCRRNGRSMFQSLLGFKAPCSVTEGGDIASMSLSCIWKA